MELSYLETRALQALRAPGGMTTEQACERWPTYGAQPFRALVRCGLAAHDGETFTITEAGRAACPFVNPLLAGKPPTPPKETAMYTERKTLRSDVLAAIVAAGPAGITRKALSEKMGVADDNISAHASLLCREQGAVVQRLKRGCFVATEHLPKMPQGVSADEAEALREALSPLVEEISEDAPAAAGPAPFSEDIELNDPEQVEFAIFSSGGLDMYTDQGNVTLSKAVLRKLRAFLGLFAEAA